MTVEQQRCDAAGCTGEHPGGSMTDTAARIREIERTPKATLARMHVVSGGQMGLATYLKWSKDELVSAVLEDEGIDPWGPR